MKVIKSIVTTEAILTDSNILENEYPAWDAVSNYDNGDYVIYQHNIYQAILNHTSSTPPNLDVTHWSFISATNRYRMFDQIISSLSTRNGDIVFTLQPNQIVDSISFFEILAATVRVVMDDPFYGVVYDRTIVLGDVVGVVDLYTYFYSAVTPNKTTAVFDDLPAHPTASITVTISSGGGFVAVGSVVYGVGEVIGRTKYGSSHGIKSFSRKETDEFGRVTVVKRKNSKYAEYDIEIDNTNIASVQRFFSDIDSVACVFIGVPEDVNTYEPLVVYGFYNDFKSVVAFPKVSTCNLRVEGLV